MVLGNLLFRRRQLDLAQSEYKRSLAHLVPSGHVYRITFLAQTHCGLGDVAFARGRFDEALKNFGKAVEIAEDNPQNLGVGYFYVRGMAGMSKSFFLLGTNHEARSRVAQAHRALRDGTGFSFNAVWEGCHPQANFELAACYAALHQNEDALECLSAAVRYGWRDLPQIEADPNFGALKGDTRLDTVVAEVQSTPRLV